MDGKIIGIILMILFASIALTSATCIPPEEPPIDPPVEPPVVNPPVNPNPEPIQNHNPEPVKEIKLVEYPTK